MRNYIKEFNLGTKMIKGKIQIDRENFMNRLNQLEAFADLIKEQVTVLKKELDVSGTSSSSSRKGLSEKEKAKISAKRRKSLFKK